MVVSQNFLLKSPEWIPTSPLQSPGNWDPLAYTSGFMDSRLSPHGVRSSLTKFEYGHCFSV